MSVFFDLLAPYHTEKIASISLFMELRYNLCNWNFVIDRKFAMGLRFCEFPGRPNTCNFCLLKIVFSFYY